MWVRSAQRVVVRNPVVEKAPALLRVEGGKPDDVRVEGGDLKK
jgi:hypothetical protein